MSALTEPARENLVPVQGKNYVLLRHGNGLDLMVDRGRRWESKGRKVGGRANVTQHGLSVRDLKASDRHRAVESIRRVAIAHNDPTAANDKLESFFEELNSELLARSNDRLIEISAGPALRNAGMVHRRIRAVDPRSKVEKAKIAVAILPRKKLKVAINFVLDYQGKKLSKWTRSFVPQWRDILNGIFVPQANIQLKILETREVVVAGLKAPVTDSNWPSVAKERSKRADLNIFLVGSWLSAGKRDDPNGEYFRAIKCAVVDDRPTIQLFCQTLSHEIGHHLFGKTHPSGEYKQLMSASPRQGSKITFDQAIHPLI